MQNGHADGISPTWQPPGRRLFFYICNNIVFLTFSWCFSSSASSVVDCGNSGSRLEHFSLRHLQLSLHEYPAFLHIHLLVPQSPLHLHDTVADDLSSSSSSTVDDSRKVCASFLGESSASPVFRSKSDLLKCLVRLA